LPVCSSVLRLLALFDVTYHLPLWEELSSVTKRLRRVGEFDWKLLRRAAFLNGPTDIALTCTDYLRKENGHAIRFEQLQDETIKFVEKVERVAGASFIGLHWERR
jgi:adenylosuccinate synthase